MSGRLLGRLGRYTGAAFSGAAVGKLRMPAQRLRDVQDGGTGRVAGTVKEKGSPDFAVYRRVRLFVKASGRLIREAWSNATTGAYSFDNVALGVEYVVLSHDHTGNYNAVVKDSIYAEAMA